MDYTNCMTGMDEAQSVGFRGEPALADLIGDPMTQALMTADHVRGQDLDALLRTARCRAAGGCD